MKRTLLFSVLLVSLFSVTEAQTKHTVLVGNYAFNPQNVNITVGDTVEWQWVDGAHTTTSDSLTGGNVWNANITSATPVFKFVITAPGVHSYHCIPHIAMGMTGTITASLPTSVDEQNLFVSQFKLAQNYPNPFNPSTVIKYNLPVSAFVALKVYNILGNEVTTLVNENQGSGEHSAVFDISKTNGIASGAYFYTLKAGNFEKTRKMLLMK